jgi:hypothetical protein
MIARDESLLHKAPFHFEPVVDSRRSGVMPRIRHRFGYTIWRRTGRFTPACLGYGVTKHLRTARHSPADLTIAHSPDTLWVALQLSGENRRIGIDFENWFSETFHPDVAARHPVAAIRDMERRALKTASYRLAPTRAMARALAEFGGVEPPTCVYNAYPLADLNAPAPPVEDRRRGKVPSLHWYSSTISAGRGLRTLFAALPLIRHPVEVHLRGDLNNHDRHWLSQNLPDSARQRILVHHSVHNSEMLPRIASHDIGLALESGATRGRDLTVAKRTFHYMLASLAVVATKTTGHEEIAEATMGAMKLTQVDNPAELAAALDSWLAFPDHLKIARQAAFAATRASLCWEKVRESLLDEAAIALAS